MGMGMGMEIGDEASSWEGRLGRSRVIMCLGLWVMVMEMEMVTVMVMSSEKSRRTWVSLGFCAMESALGQKKGII